jgi:hypothetical protein
MDYLDYLDFWFPRGHFCVRSAIRFTCEALSARRDPLMWPYRIMRGRLAFRAARAPQPAFGE